ncbi:MAG: serine hydrolase domain-containing protein [Bacteroidota bacterium]
MKKIIPLLFLFVCFCKTQIHAQSVKGTVLTIGSPEKNNFSAERLSHIDKVVQQYIDSGWINGAIALVAKNGQIVYYKGIGFDDKENKQPMKKDAIFRIASQTKAITSVAIMQLVEEGKILLDDQIWKYIPSFRMPVVLDKFNPKDSSYTTLPAKKEITIRDLLTHTSGIGYAQIGAPQMNAIYSKAGVYGGIGLPAGMKLSTNILRLAKLPLMHSPGEKWTYGLNDDVLGYLVEVLTGLSFNEYLKKNIFEPLGMKDTYFYIPQEKQSRLAKLYTEDSLKHAIKMPEIIQVNGDFYRDYPNTKGGTFYSGGGGLASTAYDYAIFMQMLLNGGDYNGKHILSKASIRLMTTNQIGNLSRSGLGADTKFGLGFELVTASSYGKSYYSMDTFSWGGMFSSSYWIDPKEKIVAQFVLQMLPSSHGDINEKFKVQVYQALQ